MVEEAVEVMVEGVVVVMVEGVEVSYKDYIY